MGVQFAANRWGKGNKLLQALDTQEMLTGITPEQFKTRDARDYTQSVQHDNRALMGYAIESAGKSSANRQSNEGDVKRWLTRCWGKKDDKGNDGCITNFQKQV
eukprot:1186246-Prorocentrum_minimum.AAC.1